MIDLLKRRLARRRKGGRPWCDPVFQQQRAEPRPYRDCSTKLEREPDDRFEPSPELKARLASFLDKPPEGVVKPASGRPLKKGDPP